jgi:hypothetical protein
MSDKIEKIRITLALNAKQIAERMLSGEVTSDSDFVSQEDHQHVARRLLDLLAASHREIAKLRAEIDGLEAELALMKSGFEIAYRAMGDKP